MLHIICEMLEVPKNPFAKISPFCSIHPVIVLHPVHPWLFTGVFPGVFPAVSGLEGFSKKKIHPRALWALRCWEDFPGRISSGDWGSWCIPTVQAGFTKAWDHGCLGGVGFKYFLFSPRSLRKWSNLTNIFQMDWNHQQVVFWWGFVVVDTL